MNDEAVQSLKAIKDKHSANFLANYDLRGMGVGHKKVNGVFTDIPAVVFMVKKKLPKSQIPEEQLLPSTIEGTPCDVVEIGEIKACALTANVRPAIPGYSCGHPSVTAGTLGCVVYGNDSNRYILSNNHVMANLNNATIGDPIYQPGVYDGGTSSDTIANLSNFVPLYNAAFTLSSPANATYGSVYTDGVFSFTVLKTISGGTTLYTNQGAGSLVPGTLTLSSGTGDATINFSSMSLYHPNVDAAIAQVTIPSLANDIGYWGGNIIQYTNPALYDVVYKTGRTTTNTKSVITYLHTTVFVNYGITSLYIDDCFITNGNSIQGGDSGSCARLDNNTAVGLVFAGSQSNGVYISMNNIVSAFNLNLPLVSHPISYNVPHSLGPLFPQTTSNSATAGQNIFDSGGGLRTPFDWTNTNNAKATDGVVAADGPMNATQAGSHYLKLTNFGFNIPNNAVIMGMYIGITCNATGTYNNSLGTNLNARFFNESETYSVSWSAQLTQAILASPSPVFSMVGLMSDPRCLRIDLPSTQSWTPDLINSSDFGVIVYNLVVYSPVNYSDNVDSIQVTIDYVTPAHTTLINPTHSTSTKQSNTATITP